MLAPGLEAAGHVLVDDLGAAEAMVDFTQPDAVAANVRAAVAAGVPSVVGTTGWDTAEFADAPVAVFYAPELRDRRGADDAVRRRRRRGTWKAPRSSSCTTAAKLDAPSGTAKLTAERMGGDVPIHSVRLPGLNAHQEVILGGPGPGADDPPRRRPRARRTRRACCSRSRSCGSLPPGLTVGLDALL